ncbi:phenylalanine ammonia-lyase, partial [Suillus clintonianus]|uniref:phenylalanine ammonia-lyase n=1 Tax=Suillus clintonianus TaxID=1904413 RepID=UPI001B86312E
IGGSADTRTDDPIALGAAPLQHQHAGVILHTYPPSPSTAIPTLSTIMPPPWTRAALLVRANSLMRGHSGVRWELVQTMAEVLNKGVTPAVPVRGSVSASGDLSSLSYVAATLIGNPAIRAWVPLPHPSSAIPNNHGSYALLPAPQALQVAGITPLPLSSKEHLGILNG